MEADESLVTQAGDSPHADDITSPAGTFRGADSAALAGVNAHVDMVEVTVPPAVPGVSQPGMTQQGMTQQTARPLSPQGAAHRLLAQVHLSPCL